jgi:hypothetical protein
VLIETIWKDFDVDESGYIERTEINEFIDKVFLKAGLDNNINKKVRSEFFRKIDTDQNGQISKDEMASFLVEIGKLETAKKLKPSHRMLSVKEIGALYNNTGLNSDSSDFNLGVEKSKS